MESPWVLAGLVVGLLLGSVAAWYLLKAKIAPYEEAARRFEEDLNAERTKFSELQAERGRLTLRAEQADDLEKRAEERAARIAELEGDQREQEARIAEREKNLQDKIELIDEHLKTAFATVSAQALTNNNTSFITLAETKFDEREKAVKNLVNPINEALKDLKTHVNTVEKKFIEDYGGVKEQLTQVTTSTESLRKETAQLVNALGKTSKRARWGEMHLIKVCELAGMVQRCDFTPQLSTDGDTGKLRPDVVVHMPGDRNIVIDAKTPFDNFFSGSESENEQERAMYFKKHAKDVRDHINSLSQKKYWEQFDNTPELVVLFLPLESMWSIALEADSNLLDFGLANRVLVATPVTIISILLAAQFAWRNEQLALNAQEIGKAGAELYKRVSTFASHVGKLGKSIGDSANRYNAMVGSLESNFLPQARRMHELQGAMSDDLTVADQLNAIVRHPVAKELEVLGECDLADQPPLALPQDV